MLEDIRIRLELLIKDSVSDGNGGEYFTRPFSDASFGYNIDVFPKFICDGFGGSPKEARDHALSAQKRFNEGNFERK